MKTNAIVIATGAAALLTAITPCIARAETSTAPGTSQHGSGSGKSAGVEGGAGAAGQQGTDPATLSRTEEQRIKQQNAKSGNPQAGSKRQDWKQ
ncbi:MULTISPECIES: hypothetical protein [unclassified Caballeronia]|uniref:hypothetical protein n=1 Tax=unclassified Caballeronia TaxID=2646786 RepID=UPI00285B70C8|nr:MULTISPECIES: hypothetical protein [unclassified Caballeronia]MDR5752296.1 hypothetical protein [Caballeronia sp. LZ024]MDR5841814.1 hypothetical protein [Caballeronia sp. LZ031]